MESIAYFDFINKRFDERVSCLKKHGFNCEMVELRTREGKIIREQVCYHGRVVYREVYVTATELLYKPAEALDYDLTNLFQTFNL